MERVVREYDHCLQELRCYKKHVIALQEDLREVEKENNTLRLITEKSQQSRRMSILISENEALFQSNWKLCQQLEDIDDDIEEEEQTPAINFDTEKTRLTRQVETLHSQNAKLEKEMRQLKEKDTEIFKEYLEMKRSKANLDDKILDMTDLLSEAEERYTNSKNELHSTNNKLSDIMLENNCKTLKIQELRTENIMLGSQLEKLEGTMAANEELEKTVKQLEEKINKLNEQSQSKVSKVDILATSMNEKEN